MGDHMLVIIMIQKFVTKKILKTLKVIIFYFCKVNSKDALVDSYNKKVNEIQKVNDSFIEK